MHMPGTVRLADEPQSKTPMQGEQPSRARPVLRNGITIADGHPVAFRIDHDQGDRVPKLDLT
jgi:hypothetical protein